MVGCGIMIQGDAVEWIIDVMLVNAMLHTRHCYQYGKHLLKT